jgi:hypothetical protein
MSRLLDPNLATRLVVAELASRPWFKRSLALEEDWEGHGRIHQRRWGRCAVGGGIRGGVDAGGRGDRRPTER